ncbi:MAG: transcription termination factor Rho, partial [Gemmatimonadota bacterium]|nr:transcription termination factor Rho [Gemmatimonadota bacterium]
IMSGGLDTKPLQNPKHFIGSARTIMAGGSLTIVATALIETGSRMDEVIFEEFKGTGNMELVLAREIAEQRIYPAIDLNRSSTRKEELLLSDIELNRVFLLRNFLSDMPPEEAIGFLVGRMKMTGTNAEFLDDMTRGV